LSHSRFGFATGTGAGGAGAGAALGAAGGAAAPGCRGACANAEPAIVHVITVRAMAIHARTVLRVYGSRAFDLPVPVMRCILFDSPRVGKCLVKSLFIIGIGAALGLGCQPKTQNVSVDAGGGKRKGSPPMCYQYRGEARKTYDAYDIILHLNNSCSYAVDCLIYDDVSEKQNQLVMPPHQALDYTLAENVQASRVDLSLECIWKP
jgi:hypothetical protein